MVSSHWDAYGQGAPDVQGRTVRPGANDDALGPAGVIELARILAAGRSGRTDPNSRPFASNHKSHGRTTGHCLKPGAVFFSRQAGLNGFRPGRAA